MIMAALRQSEGADGGTIGTIMIFAIILVLVAKSDIFLTEVQKVPPRSSNGHLW